MSGFGPPPGAPEQPAGPSAPESQTGMPGVGTVRRRPAYLPPGGLTGAAGSGVGGPPAYPLRAQRPLFITSHKPGIVSLRPMGLTDILDGAVKHVRRNPGPVLGTALAVLVVAALPSVLAAGWLSGRSTLASSRVSLVASAGELSTLLLLLGGVAATLVLTGLQSWSTAEAVLGRRPRAGQLWAAGRRRLLPLLGLAVIVAVALALPFVVYALVLAVLIGVSGPAAFVLAIVLGVLGFPLAAAASAAVSTRTSAAPSVVVLEGLAPWPALRRSWALTRGAFWRTLWRVLVIGAIAFVVFWIVQLPLLVIAAALVDLADASRSVSSLLQAVTTALATALSATVVIPFIAGANTLLYVDRRMRTEGFDLVLRRAATQDAGRDPADPRLAGGPQ